MMKKMATGLALGLAMSFATPGMAAPTNAELKIGISQEFETLNPLIMSMSASVYMYRMVGRSLVVLTPEGKWVTQLAKEIPSLDKGTAKIIEAGGKKKVQANWEIIEAAKWGDGKPVICQDFITAHKIATSANVSVGEKENWTQVEKIDIDPKNPKKCTFTYDKAKWDFYQLAQFFPVPTHLELPVFEKYGKQKEGYDKNSTYVRNPTNPGLYNGPYVITDVKLGSHVAFAPNPQFYGKQPNIKKVVVKLIPNTGTMEANLRSGTIDMISTLGMDFDQALAFDKKVKAEKLPYVVHFVPSVTYEHIDLKLDNPILADVKVRKALLTSINREDLVKALFENKQEVAIHNVSPKDPWFTTDPKFITKYPYSKRNAGKLLDEAGWKMGADGIRVKDGKRLSLNFQTTAGNKTRELVQVYLQNQWKQSGIEVLVKNEPARVFFGDTMTKRKFEGLALFAWVSSPENSPRSTVGSKSIPTKDNGWSGQNFHGWKNPEVDKNLDALDVEFNAKKREEIVHNILKLYTDEVPVLPLFYRSDISVSPANLKNYKMAGHQFYETNNIEDWNLN
ncbi:ABC transporter substrate-binding protein [Bdellovibrio bacteriovorus]|uniref:ABC transporter substrate-binding protein n=1 Tax=Bdellovibrio bacteriovorus TaxID=959 RepID=A0A150WIT0_BDEBC|nr:peptide ABC transporter substrate-binding protein [Bdellovibrio bacteriovorus]KYG63697.1 ABC transporter substrate-binding protein [Bdellovibrio bacteriovorus]